MHNFTNCQVADCEECQGVCENGIAMACDNCGTVGYVDADGWRKMDDDLIYCSQCAHMAAHMGDVR